MHNRYIKVIYFVTALILAAVFLFPVLWVIISSFKGGSELFSWPPAIFPKEPTLENYINAFERGNFALYFQNSAIVTILSTILAVIINTMAGYAFSKYQFRGRNIIFMIFIATIMLPLEVLMIPIFQAVKDLGMYNTLIGIIIPPAATPTGVFLIRQYFMTVPDELMEAARIDGAS